jgi:hypothetical protein
MMRNLLSTVFLLALQVPEINPGDQIGPSVPVPDAAAG